MRRAMLLLSALLVLSLLGSDSSREYDDRAQEGGIEGVWQVLWVESLGNRIVADRRQYFTYQGGKFYWASSKTEGTYTVDDSHRPARLAEQSACFDGVYKSIVRIDGDTLRMAHILQNERYPVDFNDPDINSLVVCKRVR